MDISIYGGKGRRYLVKFSNKTARNVTILSDVVVVGGDIVWYHSRFTFKIESL